MERTGRRPLWARATPVFAFAVIAMLGSVFAPVAEAQYAGVVVITEINYHPAGGGQDLEFIELHNASSSPVDMSDWFFSAGVAFVFPPGTWLDVGQYLVVCANEARVQEVYGITNTIGDWNSCSGGPSGCALSNAGEAIELSERPGVVAARVRYNDRGKWPAAADGTGHSLELRDVYSEQDDPDRWSASGDLGGSPGRPNRTAEHTVPVVINEGLMLTSEEPWVELFNTSEQEVDLSGFFVTDDRANPAKARLPEETTIAPRGWLTLRGIDLGLDFTPVVSEAGGPARTFVALSEPAEEGDGIARIVDAYIFEPEIEEMSEARTPDGDNTRSDRAIPTPGAANRLDVEDSIVVNEIMYHPIDLNPDAEYLELYNRGDEPVDLTGWELTRGFNYAFAPGTVMAPDSYLVVARNPDYIREVYGLSEAQVVGPDPNDEEAVAEFGRLRDDGEPVVLRDANGNIADTVRYQDGGQWPLWPDGGGSSAELIDPYHNNNNGAAWDSSDDSAKSEVQTLAYDGLYMTNQPEFHLALNHRGIALIDDLRLFERAVVFHPSQVLIEVGDEWKYFKGTEEASDPPDLWRQPGFDDADWLTGATPIGFGEEDEATVIDDMRSNYSSLFFRKEFIVDDPASLDTLVFSIEYDDGYIAYLNGERVAFGNMRLDGDDPQDSFDALARAPREKVKEDVNLAEFQHLLVPGPNVLAVQVHNSTITSADLRFIPRMATGVFVNEDGPNQIANGDFEEEILAGLRLGGWLIEGTHVRSGRTTADPISGAASLKLVASAKGDNKVNRLEQTLPALRIRSTYMVELKAKWIVGSATLLTHGHNQANANFDYAKSHWLRPPQNLGTPGAPNSVTLRQIARTGSSNIGPVISKVEQTPATPGAGEDVSVIAKVEDPDGVRDVKLVYWLEDTRGQPGPSAAQEIPMEGPGVRGRYTATIPGQTFRTRVVFYITASDAGGREGRFPVDNSRRTHPIMLDPENPNLTDLDFLVYRHDNSAAVNPRLQSYRFYMGYASELQMGRQRLLSNDRMRGSFVFNNRDLYYNAKVRFAGSPWARGGFGGSYRVYMPKDRPLHGSSAIKRFNMEDHQRGGSRSVLERLSHYLIRHNQGNTNVPYSFQWLVQWQMNDRINTAREHIQAPNRQFVEHWFPDDDQGDFFEVDDRFEINDGGSRQNSIDARWTYPPMRSGDPEDKENYRWFFNMRMNKGLDDYTRLIETAKILDSRITPNEAFDEVVWDHINVEQMLRVWAIRMNTDDWDTWGTDRGKNCYLYRPMIDGRWHLFAWDMELTYNDVNRFMPPTIDRPYNTINTGKFPDVYRLINRPRIKRLYYGIMADMIDHQFNSRFLAPYLARVRALSMSNYDRMQTNGWIDQRASRLRQILRTAVFPTQRLAITTNGGEAFVAEQSAVVIEGRAPVNIVQIQVLIGQAPLADPISASFSDEDVFGWSATVPLAAGLNEVEFLGFDRAGSFVDSDDIAVTHTPPAPPSISSVEPLSAESGDRVTIQGANLHAGLTVLFGPKPAVEVSFAGLPESLSAVVPEGLPVGEVDLILRSGDGSVSNPYPIAILPSTGAFVRGDVDLSGRISIADAVKILLALFRSQPIPCADAADADDSGRMNISDAFIVLNYLFHSGPAPAAPFPEPGGDLTADELGCETGL